MYEPCACNEGEARYERMIDGRPVWMCARCWHNADEADRRARRLREITDAENDGNNKWPH